MPVKVVQISDTHLTHLGGVTNANFQLIVEFVNEVLQPDLIVNSGDIVILNPDSAADKETAKEMHQAFKAPVRFVPGNHDVGEPGANPWAGISVTSERVANFRDAYGPDHWLNLEPEVAVIGMNSEIMGSGLPEEAEQWKWLEGVPEQIGDRRTLLFLHKPFWSPIPDTGGHQLTIPEAARDQILAILSGVRLESVGSGHLHQYSYGKEGELTTVSAPSTAFVVRSHNLGSALKQLGVVEYAFEGDAVIPYFRAASTLTEAEPFTMPEFKTTMAEISPTAMAETEALTHAES
jgi:3',5'-cyclic AMP phosphodiesterase CpdA